MEEYMQNNYITSLDQALTTEQKDTLFNNLGLPIKVNNVVYVTYSEPTAGNPTEAGTMNDLKVYIRYTRLSSDDERIAKVYLASTSKTMDAIVEYKTYRIDTTPGATSYASGHQVMELNRTATCIDDLEMCYRIQTSTLAAYGSITEIDVFNGYEVYHVYITSNPEKNSALDQKGKFAITITK